MNKRPGAPRLTPQGTVSKVVTISREDVAYLLTIHPELSKAIRQVIKERKEQ